MARIRAGGSPGNGGAGPLNNTWLWDGTAWHHAFLKTDPPVRAFASMTFDATQGRIVLFGAPVGGN